MPPKATAASSDTQRSKDALYIFDSLFDVTNPVTINVAEIAEKTNAKANTLQKRFSLIRARYPGLNIQTTVSGGVSSSGATAAAPPTPKANRKATAAKATSSKRPSSRKPEPVAQDDGGEDADDDDEESEDEIATSPTTQTLTTNNTNVANSKKAIRKPAAKPNSTGNAKPKMAAQPAKIKTIGSKRKHASESPSPAPETKKPKVAIRGKGKMAKPTAQPRDDADEEDVEEGGMQDGDGSAEEHGKHSVSVHPSTGQNAKADPFDTYGGNGAADNQDLALDVVKQYANKSRKVPITGSHGGGDELGIKDMESWPGSQEPDATPSGAKLETVNTSKGISPSVEDDRNIPTQPTATVSAGHVANANSAVNVHSPSKHIRSDIASANHDHGPDKTSTSESAGQDVDDDDGPQI